MPDESLSRVADQERASDVTESADSPHQLKVVLVGFAKPNAWIEADSLPGNSTIETELQSSDQVIVNLLDDISIHGIVLHRLRGAPHVHDANAHGARHCDLDHLGVSFEPGDVVDDHSPGVNRRGSHLRLAGVDADRNAQLRDEPLDHRHHAAQVLRRLPQSCCTDACSRHRCR